MPSQKREKPHPSLSFLRPPAATREGHGGVKGGSYQLVPTSDNKLMGFGFEAVSNLNTQEALARPEKEVIQPHLPVRLPCYDFTPVTSPAFGTPLLAVKVTTSGMASSHSVTGGVYKARERIHRRMADRRLLAIPASCRRVAACNPN